MSIAPFEDDLPAEVSARSLKLLPCLTAFETFRSTEGAVPSLGGFLTESPLMIRAISSSMENPPSRLCFGSAALRRAGDNRGSSMVPKDSLFLCRSIDACGGAGGARGAVNSSLGMLLLTALFRLEARGGGASILVLVGGDWLERLLSRDIVLCASTNDAGFDETELLRSCDAVIVVGVWTSGVTFPFRAPGVRESPRTGLSACFGGTAAVIEPLTSLRFGSSNGLTPELREPADRGDCSKVFPNRASVRVVSIGEIGDFASVFELLLDAARFDFGTSCNLKPSVGLDFCELASNCCGFRRSLFSCISPIAGDAVADVVVVVGVLFSDVFLFLPLS